MLIAYDTPGQFGNQLWAYSNLIATGMSCNASIVIILQSNYYDQLDNSYIKEARKQKIYILRAQNLTARIIRKTAGYMLKKPEHILAKLLSVKVAITGCDEENLLIRSSQYNFYLVNSWEHRIHNDSFYKQSELLKQVLQPEPKSKDIAEERIQNIRKSNDIIVAVHIRRGDYKTFLDGKFYFEDEVYFEKMQQINNLLQPAKVGFAIFSNEEIDTKAFKNLNVSFSADNTAIGDMWGISLCDFIIGPLSTFSMWASFWKNVPLLFLERNTTINSMEMFSPVIAQDVQKRGKVVSKNCV